MGFVAGGSPFSVRVFDGDWHITAIAHPGRRGIFGALQFPIWYLEYLCSFISTLMVVERESHR